MNANWPQLSSAWMLHAASLVMKTAYTRPEIEKVQVLMQHAAKGMTENEMRSVLRNVLEYDLYRVEITIRECLNRCTRYSNCIQTFAHEGFHYDGERTWDGEHDRVKP